MFDSVGEGSVLRSVYVVDWPADPGGAEKRIEMCCHIPIPGLSATVPTNLTPRPTDFRFPAPVLNKLRRTFVTLGDDEGGDTGEGCRRNKVGHESCTTCESTRGTAHLIAFGGGCSLLRAHLTVPDRSP